VLAALLALASSLAWGVSDFLGGLQSRRHPLLAVMVVSQVLAWLLLVAVVAAGAPIAHSGAATAWAAGAGGIGLLALVAFYRGLAIGTMSVVAPISATGAAVPVLAGVAAGERPSALQLAGIVLALAGVVLVSRQAQSEPARRGGRTAIGLALVAALGFGSFFAMADRAEETADVAWVLLVARCTNVALLGACALWKRPRVPSAPAALGAIAAVGLLDLAANALFVIAAGEGLLSVVGVLGALYPAVTVLLARVVLGERLSAVQAAGVGICLAGVIALAAG